MSNKKNKEKKNKKKQIDKVTVEEKEKLYKRKYWFDAREVEKGNTDLMGAVYNTYFDTILINLNQYENFNLPSNFKKAVFIENKKQLTKLQKEDIVISSKQSILQQAKDNNFQTAYYRIVKDKNSLDDSYVSAHLYDYMIVKLVDETNIPLELILAKLQDKKNTQVLKIVDGEEDAMVTLGVMEVGSEGVILSTTDVEEIYSLNNSIATSMESNLELSELEVVEIEHIGMGHRACIDTNSLLEGNEGMIIGSTSHGGILVSSENHYLPYMDLRPFRVNAGSVASYCWGPNNISKYITDLEAGNKVLAVDVEGNARTVSIARIKTEIRPLLLIETKYKDTIIKTIVQDDWHVRVLGPGGEVLNVTELEPGKKVLGYVTEPGRHTGIKVEETIIER